MTFTDFINLNVNDKVDYDNAFGAQCVDLFRQYVKDVLLFPKHTGPVEGAKNLFLKYDELPLEKEVFNRIKTKNAKMGDVLVWDGTKTNKYGHVAICIGSHPNGFIVFEQDGYKQDGAKIRVRGLDNLLGVLRPKKAVL